MPLTFPGERMPLPLSASEPGSDSEVRCFAADRDLTADLPSGIQAFKPLSRDAVEKLEATLDGLRQTRLVVPDRVLRKNQSGTAGGILQDVGMPGRGLQADGLVRRLRLHVGAGHRTAWCWRSSWALRWPPSACPSSLPPLRLADETSAIC